METLAESAEISDNELDFQKPIEANVRKRKFQKYEDVEDSSEEEEDNVIAITCSICQTYWTNSGSHSIVHLKCGHTFGKSCIDGYVKEMNSLCSYAACPKCRHAIAKSDIRRIWPNKLIPENEEELKSLKLSIQEAKELLNTLSHQQIHLKNEIAHYKEELENLNPTEDLVALMKQTQTQTQTQSLTQETVSQHSSFRLLHEIRFPNETFGVIDLNPTVDMAVVSAFNSLNHKHGLRKINVFAPQISEFVAIDHKNTIRDIKHATKDALLLSTGDDMTLKLTSMKNNIVILSYQLDQPSRACAFDEKNTNVLYGGLSSGDLMIFDIRNTRSYLHRLTKPTDALPIISVVSHLDSIICTDHKNSYSWFLNEEQEYEFNSLTIGGIGSNIISSVDFKNNQFLTSTHNTTDATYFVTHLEKAEINEYDENYTMKVDWSFVKERDSKNSISRNTLFQRDEQTYACSYGSNQIIIGDNKQDMQFIPTNDGVLDIQHATIDDNEFLAASTKSSMLLYRYL